MPDENGTETTRTDAVSAEESIFGDAANDTAASVVEEQDASEQDADGETAPDAQVSEDAGEGDDAETQTDAAEELKVVVSIKGGRATIGVQRTSSDPHIETFGDLDETGLTTEVPGVIERARARWEETPKHPAYERPAPPARRRGRRQQGTAQDATAETQEAETQQQTLRLF